MIKDFKGINPDIVAILKKENISEEALFHRYSDLMVGCKDFAQSRRIKEAGIWGDSSCMFQPETRSNMDAYTSAVEISFGYLEGYMKQKQKL